MDDADDDGGQAVVVAGRRLADQVLVGVGHVAEDAGGHGGVDSGLELDEQDHGAGAVSEVDAPEHVGLSAFQPGVDVLGGDLAQRVEVELVGPIGCEVVFEEFGDGRGLGEEELVDLVVLAAWRAVGVGQTGLLWARGSRVRGGPWGGAPGPEGRPGRKQGAPGNGAFG